MKNALSSVLVSATLALSLASGAPAQAEGAGVDTAAVKQRALYDKGNKLYDQKKWKEAEAAYLEAFEVKKGYDVAGNLGDVELINSKPREAAEHLSYALREFPAGGKRALREQLTRRFNEARAEVGVLHVHVNKPGADVFVDGRPIGQAPLAADVFVEAGAHTVEAKLEGHLSPGEAITLEKGTQRDVGLTLSKLLAPSLKESGVRGDGKVGRSPPGGVRIEPPLPNPLRAPLILSGAAAWAVATGIGAAFKVAATSSDTEAHALREKVWAGGAPCTSPPTTESCQKLLSVREAHDRYANVSTWLFVGGSAVAVTTLVYAVSSRPTRTPRRDQRSASAGAAPVIGPDGVGVGVYGRF